MNEPSAANEHTVTYDPIILHQTRPSFCTGNHWHDGRSVDQSKFDDSRHAETKRCSLCSISRKTLCCPHSVLGAFIVLLLCIQPINELLNIIGFLLTVSIRNPAFFQSFCIAFCLNQIYNLTRQRNCNICFCLFEGTSVKYNNNRVRTSYMH